MPIDVIRDASVIINGVDLSDQCEAVTVTYSVALKEATTMGKLGVVRKAGLKDWSMKFDFFQNEDAGKVMATLFPLLGVQTLVKVKAIKSTVTSATNPEYQGNGMLAELPALSGEVVGEMAKCSVTFQGSDGVPLIRSAT